MWVLAALMAFLLSGGGGGEAAQEPQTATHLATRAEHERTMKLLGITALPPGASGASYNKDESDANPFPRLPDPLRMRDGRPVTSVELWWGARRAEIVEDFEREVYGRRPAEAPVVRWKIASAEQDASRATRRVVGHVDNSAYSSIAVEVQLTVVTPAGVRGPVPLVLQLSGGFGGRGGGRGGPPLPPPAWREDALSRGWGYALIVPTSIQPDNGAGLTGGIIGLANRGQPRELDDWGALSAWAWGASRALDFFEADAAVDARRVAIAGHSRYGKAALVAMAFDTRFAAAYISSSGAGGAKLHRRNFGELVENVAGPSEFHWMAGNYLKYAGNWDALPVDSHQLIALCAPRPVFIGAGNVDDDGWVDPRGMFMAAAGAGPVYALLGGRGLGTAEFPPTETAVVEGDLAFRQHAGGHTDAPNWPVFLDFAARYFQRRAASGAQ